MATFVKSRSGSKAKSGTKADRLDRPFAPVILEQARRLARRYQVVMRREADCYYGRGLEMPNALGDGQTPGECLESVKASMAAVVAFMLERGQTPPAAAATESRLVQLNLRVSAYEKLAFEAAAKMRGEGLSQFIRAAARSMAEKQTHRVGVRRD